MVDDAGEERKTRGRKVVEQHVLRGPVLSTVLYTPWTEGRFLPDNVAFALFFRVWPVLKLHRSSGKAISQAEDE